MDKFVISPEFYNDEVRCEYTISSEMKEIWAVELEILNLIQSICEKYRIVYYAFAGTMLGAVRHKGIIPWDNDIDIMMDRENYEKFCDIACKEIEHPYFFQTEKTDPGSRRGHAQIRKSDTTAILKSEHIKGLSFNQGIFVDIFPLDNIPDDEKECSKWLKHMWHLRDNYERWQIVTDRYTHSDGIKGFVIAILHIITYPFDTFLHFSDRAYRNFEKEMKKYDSQYTEKMAPLMLRSERFIICRSELERTTKFPFEMITIDVPSEYNKILSRCYGNWNEFVVGGEVHSSILFDPHKPYTNYLVK